MLVSFICYAFNLTLNYRVGGIGMRYRLYSPTRVTGQHYYADFLAQYYHQLAGLYFTGRDYLYRRRGGVAGSLVCRSNYAAYSRHWLTDDYRGFICGFALSRSTAI